MAPEREELREIVRLMNRYGIAWFGNAWEPSESGTSMAGDRRLGELLDKLDHNRCAGEHHEFEDEAHLGQHCSDRGSRGIGTTRFVARASARA
ncbi:hypothetical protein MOX02_52180 [Methylobacterium oxalidis]|uniref:Uncharacterized protein n=1 Tax=Methylobacterium oxalidis TaxID=944322 RepID=A0A512JB21_9HYPH|nr:hypothetical protein MOX02_52180 [Methylobacterium oxalidis]GLS66029.1 hypothetical protein GCM10007888_44110 [Methylobacterium oxalidis]